MADLLFVLVLAAFFALAALFVRVCERIVGPDTEAAPAAGAARDTERAAA